MRLSISKTHLKWKELSKFGGLYQQQKEQFITDIMEITGHDASEVRKASAMEDYDVMMTLERLKGKRPPEWQLKIDALEERIKRIETHLGF